MSSADAEMDPAGARQSSPRSRPSPQVRNRSDGTASTTPPSDGIAVGEAENTENEDEQAREMLLTMLHGGVDDNNNDDDEGDDDDDDDDDDDFAGEL